MAGSVHVVYVRLPIALYEGLDKASPSYEQIVRRSGIITDSRQFEKL